MQHLTKLVVSAVILFKSALAFEPDCFTSTVPRGSDCKDANLCVFLEGGSDVCANDGARAAEFGYTRAGFAPDELGCQMNAYGEGFCKGDPSEGLDLDMRFTQKQLDIIEANKKNRSAARSYLSLWPATDGYTVVPYAIVDEENGWTENDLTNMQWALNWIQVNTKLRFVKRTTEQNYINFSDGSGCWSYVGRIGGGQTISLEKGSTCRWTNTVAHEVYHALGILHEQSRSDRDDYVTVYMDEIQDNKKHNFNIVTDSVNTTPYDYASVMHYPTYGFGKTSESTTLMPKDAKYKRAVNTWFPSPSWCDLVGLSKLYGGFNTALGCKPHVITNICVPKPTCTKTDCVEYCAFNCYNGSDPCEYAYTAEELAALIDVHSGADNPLYYPLYDIGDFVTVDWDSAPYTTTSTTTPAPITTTTPASITTTSSTTAQV